MKKHIFVYGGRRAGRSSIMKSCQEEEKPFVDRLLYLMSLRTPKFNCTGNIVYDPPTEQEKLLVDQINEIRTKYQMQLCKLCR